MQLLQLCVPYEENSFGARDSDRVLVKEKEWQTYKR